MWDRRPRYGPDGPQRPYVNFALKMVQFLQFLSKSHTLKSFFHSFLMIFKNQITKVQKRIFRLVQTLPKLGL